MKCTRIICFPPPVSSDRIVPPNPKRTGDCCTIQRSAPPPPPRQLPYSEGVWIEMQRFLQWWFSKIPEKSALYSKYKQEIFFAQNWPARVIWWWVGGFVNFNRATKTGSVRYPPLPFYSRTGRCWWWGRMWTPTSPRTAPSYSSTKWFIHAWVHPPEHFAFFSIHGHQKLRHTRLCGSMGIKSWDRRFPWRWTRMVNLSTPSLVISRIQILVGEEWNGAMVFWSNPWRGTL